MIAHRRESRPRASRSGELRFPRAARVSAIVVARAIDPGATRARLDRDSSLDAELGAGAARLGHTFECKVNASFGHASLCPRSLQRTTRRRCVFKTALVVESDPCLPCLLLAASLHGRRPSRFVLFVSWLPPLVGGSWGLPWELAPLFRVGVRRRWERYV